MWEGTRPPPPPRLPLRSLPSLNLASSWLQNNKNFPSFSSKRDIVSDRGHLITNKVEEAHCAVFASTGWAASRGGSLGGPTLCLPWSLTELVFSLR